jgi:hypothetical protein
MALWSSGVTWSSGQLWGPAAPPSGLIANNKKNKHTTMKRDNYYPRLLSARPEWHANFAAKLIIYGPTLGLTTTQVDNGVADNRVLAYGLGDWLTNVRDQGTSSTSAIKDLQSGTGADPFAFPAYNLPTPPTLPVGITAVLPGALDRTFKLVQVIKGLPGYTETIGLAMGIVGSVAPPPPPGTSSPRIKVTAIQGEDQQIAQLKFFKDGHEGIWAETRRNGGAWEFLQNSSKSPILDARPLLVPGQAEVREYRARFWDEGVPNGDWCDVAKVTISP